MRGYNEKPNNKKKCCKCGKEIPIGEIRMIMDYILGLESPTCVVPYIKNGESLFDYYNKKDPRYFPIGTDRILNFMWKHDICEFKCFECYEKGGI